VGGIRSKFGDEEVKRGRREAPRKLRIVWNARYLTQELFLCIFINIYLFICFHLWTREFQ